MSRLFLGCIVTLFLAACGGGGSSGGSVATGSTAQVSGVSTPSQVTVVTPVQ